MTNATCGAFPPRHFAYDTASHSSGFETVYSFDYLLQTRARTNVYQAAAFGLIDRVQSELAGGPHLDAERITTAFWAACRGGHQEIAALLLTEGADINWIGWTDGTPLDVAQEAEAVDLAAWLKARGARTAAEIG